MTKPEKVEYKGPAKKKKQETYRTYREALKEYNKVTFPIGTRIRILDIDMDLGAEETHKRHIGQIFEVSGYQDTNLILRKAGHKSISFILIVGHDTFEVITDNVERVSED